MKNESYQTERVKRCIIINRQEAVYSMFEEMEEQITKLLSSFKEKIFSHKYVGESSYRVINYWTDLGLIDDDRINKQNWRKFTALDLIWIGIISQLRLFGFPNEKIIKTKESLFKMKMGKGELPIFEYYIIQAILFKTPIDILVFSDGLAEIASQTEFESTKNSNELKENFLLINLNRILSHSLKSTKLEAEYRLGIFLSPKELKIIQLLKNNSFKKIEIIGRNGTIKKVNITEEVKVKAVIDLIKEQEYQSITVQVEKGKTVSIERIIKHKF